MDIASALMPPMKFDGQESIQHFSHQHTLSLIGIFPEENVSCFACKLQCLGTSTYSCTKCNFFLHKRCTLPAMMIRHPSHPNHPVILSTNDGEKTPCGSCKRNVCSFVFNCFNCQWNMCIDCCLLPEHLNQHCSHSHHSLTRLMSSTEFTCSFCHINFANSAPCFKCSDCDFTLDVDCAVTPPIACEGDACFRHFSHSHPMMFVEKDGRDGGDDEYCFACGLRFTGPPYYSCQQNCQYFLHKSCALLPQKIHHPMHKHNLILTLLQHKETSGIERSCNVCYGKDNFSFLFQCCDNSCEFRICGRCIFERPNIKDERHDHLLCLVEKMHDTSRWCNAYSGRFCKIPTTSIELRSSESSMFRCVECDFNLHFLCGPLPYVIRYKYHIHPLVLVDQFVEDDSGDYYCDICESERSPRISVYCCQECKYIAHILCLMYEVVTTLKGDLAEVKLKTVMISDADDENHKLSADKKEYEFRDIIDQLAGEEKNMLWHDFDWDTPVQQLEIEDEFQVQKLSRFTPQYFEYLIEWFNRFHYLERLTLKSNDLQSEVVVVDGYSVPKTLAWVLVRLLRKHGDISSNSVSTREMKSIIFSFICQVLDSMSTTEVWNLTKDHLKEWFFFLNYAQRRGFYIQFLADHLEDVVRAFIGLQATAERNVRGTESVRANDIQKLQKKLNDLKSRSFDGFDNWGAFTMECLHMALKFMEKQSLTYSLL